jgi:NADH:ubiquinone oxidoreductase subunit 6 (subunit J)
MNGIWIDIAFWVFSAAAVWFGWRVFRTDSMVRASFALLASFLNVAAILILLLAEYLGVALFFMMAVEMTVMALFMVAFMMNPAGLNPMMMVHQHRLSIVFGIIGAAVLAVSAVFGSFPARPAGMKMDLIGQLGTEMLGNSMLIFETAGIALLATMLGAVILSSRSSRYGSFSDAGSHPPPLDPDDPESIPDIEEEEEGGGHHHHHGH